MSAKRVIPSQRGFFIFFRAPYYSNYSTSKYSTTKMTLDELEREEDRRQCEQRRQELMSPNRNGLLYGTLLVTSIWLLFEMFSPYDDCKDDFHF